MGPQELTAVSASWLSDARGTASFACSPCDHSVRAAERLSPATMQHLDVEDRLYDFAVLNALLLFRKEAATRCVHEWPRCALIKPLSSELGHHMHDSTFSKWSTRRGTAWSSSNRMRVRHCFSVVVAFIEVAARTKTNLSTSGMCPPLGSFL